MVLPYNEVIAGASTNVTAPTTEEINQGNNQLTPYNSAVNNGYYRQMSQGIANLSTEIKNVIEAAGLTPDASLDQLLEAINILIPNFASNSEVAAGSSTTKTVSPSSLLSLFKGGLFNVNVGYIRLPASDSAGFNEIIFQWGNSTISSSGTTLVFPFAYPNGNALTIANGDVAGITVGVTGKSLTSFTAVKSGTGSAVCPWFSIGF